MIVGESSRAGDLDVKLCKEKHLTNIRSSTSEVLVRLSPAKRLTLEEALDFVADDECVEVTPEAVRLRKLELGKVDRLKAARQRALRGPARRFLCGLVSALVMVARAAVEELMSGLGRPRLAGGCRSLRLMQPAIEVNDLRKSYGETEALRGVSFEVAPGEVFCMLGPNGAGKTTCTEILEGHRLASGGTVRVLATIPPVTSAGCASGSASARSPAASRKT